MKKKEVKEIIKNSLGVYDDIKESYVATPKDYDINTEMLLPKTKQSHNELYKNYVSVLNDISAKLDTVDVREANYTSTFRSLKIDEQYNLNAVYLHELYFANIGDPFSSIRMDSIAHMRLNRDFGTFDDWQMNFLGCALSSRNGWAICGYNFYLKKYVNIVVDDHYSNVLLGLYPVIVIDMWEHARRDYLNNKKDYIIVMMKELNWNVIENRFEKAEAISNILGGSKKWT